MSDPRPGCTQCSVINDTVCVHHLLLDVMKDADAFRERAEKAEALVAAYRTVLGGMRDLTLGLSRMIDEGLDTTSASTKEEP